MLLKNLNIFYSLPQLVANETRQKGQDFWKILKDFYNAPHLYKGIHKGIYAHKL